MIAYFESPESCSCRTDLPPLALAVVVLEETLVVRDTVLAENETIRVRVSHLRGL